MGTQFGQSYARLIHELEQHAPEYNVFQAIYIAERASKKLFPDRKDEEFEQQGMRFRPYENYVYPPTDIRSFSFENNEMQFVINFMGLYGVNSPLPRCYHEQVGEQQQVHGAGKVPLQNFLDIFNNRFYWLYYQAWKKYRNYLFLNESNSNKITQKIFSFIGQQDVDTVTPLPWFHLLRVSGILSNRIRNKAGLKLILQEFFPQYQFSVQEFIPKMVEVSNRPTLGSGSLRPMILGENSVVGQTVLDYLSTIRILIGPMDFQEYLQFLPGGTFTRILKKIINFYLNDSLEYDVQFLIRSEQIERMPWNNDRIRLGQSTWIGQPKTEFVSKEYSYEKFLQMG